MATELDTSVMEGVLAEAIKKRLKESSTPIPYVVLTARVEYHVDKLRYYCAAHIAFVDGTPDLRADYYLANNLVEKMRGRSNAEILGTVGRALGGMLINGYKSHRKTEGYYVEIKAKDMQFKLPEDSKNATPIEKPRKKVGNDGSKERREPDSIYPPW